MVRSARLGFDWLNVADTLDSSNEFGVGGTAWADSVFAQTIATRAD